MHTLDYFLLWAGALILAAESCGAAVLPAGKPGMAVKVEAGIYTIRGRSVDVAANVELVVSPPEKVRVESEEHVLTNDRPQGYHRGTALKRTLGPVDVHTRLPGAIVPESVRLHSSPEGGLVFEEGKDYVLDHTWGGLARLETGGIAPDAKTYVDYEVYLQRVDAVQVSADGKVSIKKGKSAAVCPAIPAPDPGCCLLAAVYVPYGTAAIIQGNICPSPAEDLTWRDFIKTSGREYLSRTLSLLEEGRPVTVVCWGDSVTSGASASSRDKCYVEVFRASLKAAYPDAGIKLINAGIGGSNTDSRREGFAKEVLAHKPDLITVEYVNDVGKSPEQIASNYAEFISRAREAVPGVEFIILTPHFVTPGWMSNFDNSVPAMRRAAAVNKVALGDTANIWANLCDLDIPYEILLANGINHPNDLGHEFFTATLMQLLAPRK